MKLYYAHTQKGNFGDDLNPFIFSRLFPELLDDNQKDILVGIGTILNHKIPKNPFKYVFGSGFGYGGRPNLSDNRWKFYCVRGPHTAAKLKLDESLSVTDPAALVGRYSTQCVSKSNAIGFIPHFESLDLGFWPQTASLAGLRFISPRAPVSAILEDIQACHVVITESLHGAIVSDCLRIPWIAVRPIVKAHREKWLDWAGSLGIVLRAESSLPSSRQEARNARWQSIRGPLKTALASNPLTLRLLNGAPQTEAPEFHDSNDKHLARGMGDKSNTSSLSAGSPSSEDKIYIERAARRLQELSRQEPQLSTDHSLNRALARLDEAAECLRRDFRP
jgi:succinoglycan biosynthesis protein ExoV